jgi:hypothetical protein
MNEHISVWRENQEREKREIRIKKIKGILYWLRDGFVFCGIIVFLYAIVGQIFGFIVLGFLSAIVFSNIKGQFQGETIAREART